MADAPQASAKLAPIPKQFPKSQLFVAVSDRDAAAAGFDGGPEKEGTGAWSRGDIRPWTSIDQVPLALRDPKDGSIVRGWVEPVEEVGERNGRPVALRATKFFAVRDDKTGEWKPAAPSEKALKRATRGAASMTKAFESVAQRAQGDRLAGTGL